MRIAGTTIPDDKRVIIALTYIFGIGPARSKALLGKAKIKESTRVKELTQDTINVLQKALGAYQVEGELRRQVSSHIKRLKDIKAYRGTRHSKRLPTRGQRTKTNSRTLRGNVRVTMGSGRRKLEKT